MHIDVMIVDQVVRTFTGLVGLGLIFLALFDVFETVVVPNLGFRHFRLTTILIRRLLWGIWRRCSEFFYNQRTRNRFLGLFAPLSILISLLVWMNVFLLGFSLIVLAFGGGISPPLKDFATAFYFSGSAVMTVGFGDIVPVGPVMRVIVIFGTMAGLTIMALVTSLVFSLHSLYQHREAQILLLEGRAGVPPCALTIYENHANLRLVLNLEEFFAKFEEWFANLVTSHTAYPFMLFFRSFTFGNSWVTSLGAVMDASMISQTMLSVNMGGSSILTYKMGLRVLNEIQAFYRMQVLAYDPQDELASFHQLRESLSMAGYELKPEKDSWEKFCRLREQYYPTMVALAKYLAMPVSTLNRLSPAEFAANKLTAQRSSSGAF